MDIIEYTISFSRIDRKIKKQQRKIYKIDRRINSTKAANNYIGKTTAVGAAIGLGAGAGLVAGEMAVLPIYHPTLPIATTAIGAGIGKQYGVNKIANSFTDKDKANDKIKYLLAKKKLKILKK